MCGTTLLTGNDRSPVIITRTTVSTGVAAARESPGGGPAGTDGRRPNLSGSRRRRYLVGWRRRRLRRPGHAASGRSTPGRLAPRCRSPPARASSKIISGNAKSQTRRLRPVSVRRSAIPGPFRCWSVEAGPGGPIAPRAAGAVLGGRRGGVKIPKFLPARTRRVSNIWLEPQRIWIRGAVSSRVSRLNISAAFLANNSSRAVSGHAT